MQTLDSISYLWETGETLLTVGWDLNYSGL